MYPKCEMVCANKLLIFQYSNRNVRHVSTDSPLGYILDTPVSL
jgi:hypothetical protein